MATPALYDNVSPVQLRCPRVPQAWFDEAYADNAAHAYGMECGAMGNCDHGTGECICRDGWTGAACERLACDDDCSEHGACLPMYRLAQLRQGNGEADAVTYGTTDLVRPGGVSVYANPSMWDFDMMYGCLCDSGEREWDDGDGFNGGIFRPRTGTRGYISGVFTDNSKLSGWDGYKCSQRESIPANSSLHHRMVPGLSLPSKPHFVVTLASEAGFNTVLRGMPPLYRIDFKSELRRSLKPKWIPFSGMHGGIFRTNARRDSFGHENFPPGPATVHLGQGNHTLSIPSIALVESRHMSDREQPEIILGDARDSDGDVHAELGVLYDQLPRGYHRGRRPYSNGVGYP